MQKIILGIALLICALFSAHAKAIYDDVYDVNHFHHQIIEPDERWYFTGEKVEQDDIARAEAQSSSLLIPVSDHRSIMITRYTGTRTNVRIPPRIQDLPVVYIGPHIFIYNDRLTGVVIPDSVTYIGLTSFAVSEITSITIPGSVTYIETSAFAESSLASVTIPDSVTHIRERAFRRCGLLTELILPDSITTIEDESFAYCSFTEITIPASVTLIETGAFHGNKLTTLVISGNVQSIQAGAFTRNNITSITIGADVVLPRNDAAFDNHFDYFYQTNGSKAGTYTFTGGTWEYAE